MVVIEKKNGCALLVPKIVNDCRGVFTVPFSIDDLNGFGLAFEHVYQLNHSITSQKGTIRGLNYQFPYPQAKVVRCIKGSFYSVGMCLSGSNKGKYVGYILTSQGREIMYIPRGYAHGLITLEDDTELEYLVDNKYCYEAAKSISWKQVGIDWTIGGKIKIREDLLSDKNRNAPTLY